MSKPRVKTDELVSHLKNMAWYRQHGLLDDPSPELQDAINQAIAALRGPPRKSDSRADA